MSKTQFVHKMPESYLMQDGCWNCYWCFLKSYYEDACEHYCRRKAPKRPKCGSQAMDEDFLPYRRWGGNPAHKKAYAKASRLWDEWANGRQVAPWGKCEKHRRLHRPAEVAEHIHHNLPLPPWRRRKKEPKDA